MRVAGERRGVEFLEQAPVTDFVVHGDEWRAAVVGGREYSADRFCVTAGAWTGKLLERAGVSVGVLPIRGQMALWKATPGLLRHIINEGPRYIVPRLDGHILAGSTEEEAGFDKRTTDEGVRGLVEFAHQYVPALRSLPLARSWAGLRPGVYDGLPFLGEIPGFRNAFLAAGHFRSGLYLSPGTAVSLAACIAGERPPIDLSPFRVSRA